MRMVQASIDNVVNVIPMRDCLVPASRAVNMARIMIAFAPRGAPVRVGLRRRDHVLLDRPIFFLVVQVPIMNVIDVAIMLDRRMATPRPVLMRMLFA